VCSINWSHFFTALATAKERALSTLSKWWNVQLPPESSEQVHPLAGALLQADFWTPVFLQGTSQFHPSNSFSQNSSNRSQQQFSALSLAPLHRTQIAFTPLSIHAFQWKKKPSTTPIEKLLENDKNKVEESTS
jgi:hypothetical protein